MNSSIIVRIIPILLLTVIIQGCAKKPADVPEEVPAVEEITALEAQRQQIEADMHKYTAVLASDASIAHELLVVGLDHDAFARAGSSGGWRSNG